MRSSCSHRIHEGFVFPVRRFPKDALADLRGRVGVVFERRRIDGGAFAISYADVGIIHIAPELGGYGVFSYVSTGDIKAMLIILAASAGAISRSAWWLPIGYMEHGASRFPAAINRERHDNQKIGGLYHQAHTFDKGCPYKIYGGGIRQAPLGGEYDEDPCTSNSRRAKMKIEQAKEGELRVEREMASVVEFEPPQWSHRQDLHMVPLCDNCRQEGRAIPHVVVMRELNRVVGKFARRLITCRQRNLRLGRRGA